MIATICMMYYFNDGSFAIKIILIVLIFLKIHLTDHLSYSQDPFNLKVTKRGPGTKECPNLVPSAFDSRMVGCICEEDQSHINWMWLHEGTPRRCECGYWFKLVEKAPL